MNLFYILYNLCALIGLLTIIVYLLIPITKSIIFACGYTLIYIASFNWRKVLKKPFKAIKEIVYRFIDGFLKHSCGVGTYTECRVGDYTYYPLFKIRKS